ncbi:protein translocase subunit SecDF [Mycoplasmopsis columbina]|uniref:protein translocase subunit SecDF n=1 Tax=Mycoplasmopsis columbina TaxID=114881 RepID=UPI0004A750D7|nr:protein translocase subunit SecDF [Mycoplasmopsis columbina]VEU77099.1 bifunctional preprotein translocase subunit SecD/SecF [Mycoplasmopsis columbina]
MFRNLRKFFKNLVSLSNWKRITIAVITLISAILTVVFGSLFYVSKNVNKSVEYGGGVEFLVQVTDQTSDKTTDKFTQNVAGALSNRLTGGTEFNGTKVQTQGDGKILITRNGSLTDAERKNFEDIIINKPNLVLTDTNMIPIFVNGEFNENKETLDYENISKYIPPLKPSGASNQFIQTSGKYNVLIKLLDKNAEREWTDATSYIASSPDQTILMWLNLDELVSVAKERFSAQWIKAKENPYNFVHVDEALSDSNGRRNILKENQIKAKDFLISEARAASPLSGDSFTITGNFNEGEAKQLAANINFGTSKYKLDILSSNYISASSVGDSFNKALIAGIIVFAIISIFMIVNYGLLGALSTISIALYVFLTLLMFTILRGEYSPVTIAALIIGIGIGVDANIITFERLKSEVYAGEKIKKAIKNSNRLAMSSIIDANLTTLIVSFTLFYFGTSAVRGFSLSLVFSVIFTLLIMLFFTKGISNLIVGTGFFNKRLWLLGIKYKKINNLKTNALYRRFDYVKHAKWFIIGSLVFVLIGLIVFSSVAGSNKEFWSGFNRSFEFQGGINISIEGKDTYIITQNDATAIKNFIINNQNALGIKDVAKYTNILPIDSSNTMFKISIKTAQDLNNNVEQIKSLILQQYPDVHVWSYGISSIEAQNLVKNALLAVGISFIGIILYTLIRLKWTYSFAAIVGLLHDVLLTIAFIVITRLELSPIIVAAVLSIIAFSINDTIVVFDRIRERVSLVYYKNFLDAKQIKEIANSSIADTIKRSLYTSLTTIMAVIVLLAFKDATNLAFNLTMIFGLAIGAYSSIFICTWLWVKLETIRQLGIKKREESKFWVISKDEEQIFPGINDFIA